MTALEEARSAAWKLSPADRRGRLDWLAREPVEVGPGIFSTPGVCGGDPCVGRMRLPVWLLEEGRRNGATDECFLEAYPNLTREDLANAWACVAAHREETERLICENNEA